MAKLLIILICLAVGAGVVWYFFFYDGGRHLDRPTRSEGPIIALGDSLTAGVGATSGSDYVSVLSRGLGEPIINAGVSGNTTGDALARLQADVLSKQPRIVIIMLGGNDALRTLPETETFANLRSMIDQIHAQGSAVLLVGIGGALAHNDYDAQFKTLADSTNVSFVPNILDGILGRMMLMFDDIHPNNKGYAIVAERLLPPLQHMAAK